MPEEELRTPPFADVVGVVEWGHLLGPEVWLQLCGHVPARVCYATTQEEAWDRDSLAFDDFEGGKQATEHLIRLGHRSIAFLGLHQEHEERRLWPSWSSLREQGWREAMQEAALSCEGLTFHVNRPLPETSDPEHERATREIAEELLGTPGITAVVAANQRAAETLLSELQNRSDTIKVQDWPSIVAFDDEPSPHRAILTTLNHPMNLLGKAFADLLWERIHNKLPETPQHRLIRMDLIPRLTSRPNWTSSTLGEMLLTLQRNNP